MKINVVRDPKKFDYYTSEDEVCFAELIKQTDAKALFLYSRNVLTKDGIKHLGGNDKSVRTIARGGVMYAPVSFFRNFLGKSVESCDGFLPLVKTCRELGIFAKTYNDGLLAIIGGELIDEQIAKNPRLIYAGGYATLGKYDAESFTAEDYRAAREKWCESIVGSPKINDMSNPYIREKITYLDERCEMYTKGLHRESGAFCLYGNKRPTDSVDLLIQYAPVATFARAYTTFGSKYYRDESVLADALYGLAWMYENMYGEAEIEERGWRSAKDYDWWHWFVGGPENLTDALLLLWDYVTKEQKEAYLKCFKWVISFMRQGYYQNCATSRIRVCTKLALILEDPTWIENEFYDYDLLCEINEDGEGPHIDYINWTHGFPYNMSYGHNNLSRVLNVGAILGGTPLEFTSPKQYNLFKIAKYMFEPTHYKGRGMLGFGGRGMAGPEYRWGIETNAHLLPMIGLFGEDEDNYIKRMIKRNSVIPEVVEGTKRTAALRELVKYIDILNDRSIPFESDYEIGHAYFTGDRAVQQRNGYAFCVALASERHPSYESINGGNKIGWYTGDGALYFYTDNDDYTYDGENFIFNEKVAYNIPGTTVDSQIRRPWSHRSGFKNPRAFAGSISTDGKYIAAAMEYASYDFRGVTTPDTDTGHGGGFLYHENDLVCKKSYFLFDKECVCLGAGISSTMCSNVKTVIENRNLVQSKGGVKGTELTLIDGEALPVGNFDMRIYESPAWASLEGVAGYVFLEKMNIGVEKYESARGTFYVEGGSFEEKVYEQPKRFLKITAEHGENPSDASYAYAILPYAEKEELIAYSDTPKVEIISNTQKLQAVRKPSLGIAYYVFYSRGACEEISVSEPCIVSVSESAHEYRISVCDPTQKLDSITVTFGKSIKCDFADDGVSVSEGEKTVISVNTTHSVGRPYSAVFKK